MPSGRGTTGASGRGDAAGGALRASCARHCGGRARDAAPRRAPPSVRRRRSCCAVAVVHLRDMTPALARAPAREGGVMQISKVGTAADEIARARLSRAAPRAAPPDSSGRPTRPPRPIRSRPRVHERLEPACRPARRLQDRLHHAGDAGLSWHSQSVLGRGLCRRRSSERRRAPLRRLPPDRRRVRDRGAARRATCRRDGAPFTADGVRRCGRQPTWRRSRSSTTATSTGARPTRRR